ELGAALPPALKLRGLREKYVLRRALGRHLPRAIVERPKQPYRAPDSESFLHRGAPPYVEALLAPEAIARTGYFEPRAVRRLVAKCRNPLDAGIIDSTGVLELVCFLETTFGIEVQDDEMLPENLDSIRAISNYVARKLESRKVQLVA